MGDVRKTVETRLIFQRNVAAYLEKHHQKMLPSRREVVLEQATAAWMAEGLSLGLAEQLGDVPSLDDEKLPGWFDAEDPVRRRAAAISAHNHWAAGRARSATPLRLAGWMFLGTTLCFTLTAMALGTPTGVDLLQEGEAMWGQNGNILPILAVLLVEMALVWNLVNRTKSKEWTEVLPAT